MAFFPSLKQNIMAYLSSKVSDSISEIHQLWESGFSRVYSNSFSSCSFKPEILKISQSSHKMYSNNIVNFQDYEILNAHTTNVWKPIVGTSYQCVMWYFPYLQAIWMANGKISLLLFLQSLKFISHALQQTSGANGLFWFPSLTPK